MSTRFATVCSIGISSALKDFDSKTKANEEAANGCNAYDTFLSPRQKNTKKQINFFSRLYRIGQNDSLMMNEGKVTLYAKIYKTQESLIPHPVFFIAADLVDLFTAEFLSHTEVIGQG